MSTINAEIMKYEIPYDQLQIIGLSATMVDALPESVKTSLTSGELTPLILLRREMENGVVLSMPMKLRMDDTPDGGSRLLIYPMNTELKNSLNLSEKDFRSLKEGDIINVAGTLHQRDPETNCIVSKREKQLELDRRIAELEKVRDIELGTEQKNQLKEGKPVELNVGGEKVTVGLDLRDKDHFKTLKGDMQEWKRQQEIDYDIAHPEFVGLVQTDQNRWEKQMVSKEGLNSQTLKEQPAQTRSSGMRI